MHILFAYDCVVVVDVVVGRYFFVHPLFSCIIFFKFSFSTCCCFSSIIVVVVVVVFDVVVLAYWFCFYVKTCSSRHILYLRCYWVSI